MNIEAARGALLGLAVGDALGTTYEFQTIEQPAYPALATGPATDVVGEGPFHLEPGAITDDTQLAVCLARSLAERGGLDLADLGTRYCAWSLEAFDIGNQTNSSISHLENGVPATDAGLATWRTSGRGAAGNGSLMRTAPIGVAFATRDGLVDAAMADSLITHADPRCALACAVFDAAIGCAVAGDASAAGMLAAARAALPRATELLAPRFLAPGDGSAVADGARAIAEDLDQAERDTPGVYGGALDLQRTPGFVRVALRLALWHLAHATAWRDALVDVASRGGDADTNGAIVGALLGARFGETAIPEAWRLRVLAAKQRGSDAWGDAHHPRHLLALVAR